MPTTTANHSYLKDSRASGSSTQKVLNQLIDSLDSDVPVTGQFVASGDGAATAFTDAHGLSFTPSRVVLTPTSADAAADHHVSTVDGTNIEVTFAAAPASGTDNITFDWAAYP